MEISGIHFKNISYEGRGEKPSRIQVLKGQGTIRDIWFENFRINGKPVRSNRDWDLKVDPESKYNINNLVIEAFAGV
jgi:hypothetical protein